MQSRFELLTIGLALLVTLQSACAQSLVVPYREYGARKSGDFTVRVNGQDVFVADHTGRAFSGPTNRFAYAHFAFAGRIEVTVTVPGRASDYTLSPKSLGINVRPSGNTLSFALVEPRKVLLWKPSSYYEHKLAIWADPLEDDAPAPDGDNVFDVRAYGNDLQQAIDAAATKGGIVYVPEGQYRGANLRSNVSVYLAPGSKILGRLFGSRVSNVKVYGRGAVEGGEVRIEYGNNITYSDFVTINHGVAVLYDCRRVTVYNLKNFRITNRAQTFDGNGCSDCLVDNVFFWSADDATAIGYRHNQDHVVVRNSVLGTWGTGSAMKIHGSKRPGQSEPMYSEIKQYTYENIDVLLSEARFTAVYQDCGGDIHDLYWKNIRFEHTLVEGNVIDIGYTTFDRQRNAFGFGQMYNFYFQNVRAEPGKRLFLHGLDANHKVRNVTFDNFYMKGELIDQANEVATNQFVEQLSFRTHDPIFVNVTATKLFASEGGAAGEFTVTRTGPVAAGLSVPILVRGTAKPGTDYTDFNRTTVTFAPGQSSVQIPVVALKDSQREPIETVHLCLQNEPLQTVWSVGPGHHAIVNILDGPAAAVDPVRR